MQQMKYPSLDRLTAYLNSLSRDEQDAFSKACGTTIGNLRQIGYGHRRCTAESAITIHLKTAGVMPASYLCPDIDWAEFAISFLLYRASGAEGHGAEG